MSYLCLLQRTMVPDCGHKEARKNNFPEQVQVEVPLLYLKEKILHSENKNAILIL